MRYHTIKIPASAWRLAKELQRQVIWRGIDAMPAEVRSPPCCPLCERAWAKADARGFACSCGYAQSARPSAALGVLVGLATTHLLQTMRKAKGPLSREGRSPFRS